MARRRYGSGSVTLRSDGRWEGRIRLPDGSRRFLHGRNRRQLVTRLQDERWRIDAGIPRSANGLTLGEYLPEWLEVCRRRLRPKTFDSYALCAQRPAPAARRGAAAARARRRPAGLLHSARMR
jgi:hypothetical protein